MQKALWICVLALVAVGSQCCAQKRRAKTAPVTFGQEKHAVLPSSCSTKVKTGIRGKIWLEEGNRMPGPGAQIPAAKGVSRYVFFYPASTLNEVEVAEAGFYYKWDKAPVLVVKSDANGCFTAPLPAGLYSVAVWEQDKWYANSFDEKSRINAVEVPEGQVVQHELRITHSAVY